jgi:hypothetical protein
MLLDDGQVVLLGVAGGGPAGVQRVSRGGGGAVAGAAETLQQAGADRGFHRQDLRGFTDTGPLLVYDLDRLRDGSIERLCRLLGPVLRTYGRSRRPSSSPSPRTRT